jgi:toxin ParE1/3/4
MAKSLRSIVWAPKARRDLIDIWKYFSRVASSEIADKVLRDIDRGARRLCEYPYSGRPRDEIARGLRPLLVRPHSIIHRVTETTVEITRIIHERRDFAAVLTKDGEP